MAMLVMDPHAEGRLKDERERLGTNHRDEVWDGVYVAMPLANNEHQWLASQLWLVLYSVVDAAGDGVAYNGVNVSDRVEDWPQNYREPDVAVFLKGNSARDCGTHWC